MNKAPGRLGAHRTERGVEFLVWAPAARAVEVRVESPSLQISLRPATGGYYRGLAEGLKAGALYRYWVDGKGPYPDPASSFQPQGPHGPSMVVDEQAHRWSDAEWTGIELARAVIYELHIGAFTPEGTFAAAAEKLPYLKSVGITVIEVMPVAECPGRWNWGYDGVQWFAPYREYGDYDAFKRFVDRAHRLGMAVILDVVYNHFGPDGNYLNCFSPFYITERHATEWGPTLNYDDANAHGVRELVLQNACYWIEEFHLDGLRLDATQSIHDSSRPHLLAELTTRTRRAAGDRTLLIVAENEPQHARHLLPIAQGGFGLDAMWNDDFHHAARVALTGRRGAYFHDYLGSPQEFISAVKRGFLFQGQYYHWQKQCRGQPLRTPRRSCVAFLQNHDQVSNSVASARLNTLSAAGCYRALSALLLLGPNTPLLFMGEEFGATTPFLFFADHNQSLSKTVHAGRREFLKQFPGAGSAAALASIADPAAASTFQNSKLDWREMEAHRTDLQLHVDLLKLRAEDAVLTRGGELDGAVLGSRAFVLRWFDAEHGDRLLLVNLGADTDLHPAPEPLLAAPVNANWELQWSSDDIRYGGLGVVDPHDGGRWHLPAQAAVFFKAGRST